MIEKNHVNQKKYSSNKKEKICSLFLSVSLFSGSISSIFQSVSHLEKVVKVSENVRKSFYEDNYKGNYENNNLGFKDTFITDKSLENVSFLEIDRLKTDDFSFLQYCTNLENLVVFNAQALTNQDIVLFSKMNVNCFFYFDIYELVKLSYMQDITPLKGKNVKIVVGNDELSQLVLYYSLNGLDSSFEGITLARETFLKIDAFLENLIPDNIADSVEEQILNLVGNVSDYLEYDTRVSFYLDDLDLLNENEEVWDLCLKYNQRPLSIYTKSKKENKGICTNFASILVFLLQKCGFESYVITGSYDGVSHAWVMVNVLGEYKYIDMTFLDANPFFKNWWYKYKSATEKEVKKNYFEKMKKILFVTLDDLYIAESNVEKMQTKMNLEEIFYYNENIEGKYVDNLGVDWGMSTSIGVGSGVMSVLYTRIRKKKD